MTRTKLLVDFHEINLLIMSLYKSFAQRGARTHDPEIKSLMLYRLS